jgi:hypothetical protein
MAQAVEEKTSPIHVFGIRHHGPGSARSLCESLKTLRPDIVLIEGPPDAQDIIHYAVQSGMEPPVALLVYDPDCPHEAAFYPFAVFSPEWQAIQYSLHNQIPVRFMDLPQSFRMAGHEEESAEKSDPAPETETTDSPQDEIRRDPIQYLAQTGGYSDGERWWDYMVESRRQGSENIFAAIRDAMTVLRENQDVSKEDIWEQRREAYMRTVIRQAVKEGFQRIAIVCGAWHCPALIQTVPAKQDQQLMTGLKKVKTQAAWVPWSYDQLSFASGYRAGVLSPEWYHLIWHQPANLVAQWMTQAARLMRSKDIDTSSAHVIESVRLAQTLAAIRNRAIPGLEEMDEAALTVMCFGQESPMQLIRQQLIIGYRLGKVPDEIPSSPLQLDFAKQQKRLRLPVTTEAKEYDFDLRNENDLQRSHLLHRLLLLHIPWGQKSNSTGKKAGTFHEYWLLQWKPEYVMGLIHACRWGNSVQQASEAKCIDAAKNATDLPALTGLLEHALMADLPRAVEDLIQSIGQITAVSADIPALMRALPPLARVLRYGNVRQMDLTMIQSVVQGLASRIMIHLPGACSSINDEAAEEIFRLFNDVQSAIQLIQIDELTEDWMELLDPLIQMQGIHPKIGGRGCRVLFEQQKLDLERLSECMSYFLSLGNEPDKSAAWMEGFLWGSGAVLIHYQVLLGMIDRWLCSLADSHFMQILPVMRKTFSVFPQPERRQIGQYIAKGRQGLDSKTAKGEFSHERAAKILPLLGRVLGLEELS